MGIKRKIVLGFISIGSLLFLSGLISSAELLRLNRSTYQILQHSTLSIELSKRMLDAVQEQNTSLLMCVTDTTKLYDSLLQTAGHEFDRALSEAQAQIKNSPDLHKITEANIYYNNVVSQRGDSVTLEWFSQIYKTPYYNLTHSIKEFMVSTQRNIVAYTQQLENNAYRASMVGIIALAGGVLLMMLFYFVLNRFFVTPILAINRAVHNNLNQNIPFDVKVDTKDEISELNDNIGQIIARK
ncbi:MAG: hypothetical protein RR931_04730 [Mucinivorans sp.]